MKNQWLGDTHKTMMSANNGILRRLFQERPLWRNEGMKTGFYYD